MELKICMYNCIYLIIQTNMQMFLCALLFTNLHMYMYVYVWKSIAWNTLNDKPRANVKIIVIFFIGFIQYQFACATEKVMTQETDLTRRTARQRANVYPCGDVQLYFYFFHAFIHTNTFGAQSVCICWCLRRICLSEGYRLFFFFIICLVFYLSNAYVVSTTVFVSILYVYMEHLHVFCV